MKTIFPLLAVGGLICSVLLFTTHLTMTSRSEVLTQQAIASMFRIVDEKEGQAEAQVEIPVETAGRVVRSALSSQEMINSMQGANIFAGVVVFVLSISLFLAARRTSNTPNSEPNVEVH